MKQYKIEIYCDEEFADKGIEVLNYIWKMLEKKYGEDAKWTAFGGYVREDKKIRRIENESL